MTSFAISRDGARIAYDRTGTGPPLVLVAGILCDRNALRPLADRLSHDRTVVNYDRRGRGESDAGPDERSRIDREVDDLGALLDELGGAAAVYGHSSGAGLAAHAAARGLPITRLVLHEPPWGPDDDASVAEARDLAETIRTALDEGRPGDAVKRFLADSGMPPEMIEGASRDPAMLAVAPTMVYDLEIMGDFDGGIVPEDLVGGVVVPTLVLAGGASPEFFRTTAARVAELLPHGEYQVLDEQDHGAPADAVAPAVAAFLAGRGD